MTQEHINNIKKSYKIIQKRLNGRIPKLAIMLGSGLGDFAENITDPISISYADLAGFPIPTVAGHKGEIIIGQIKGVDVLCLKGRMHLYETHNFTPLKVLIRTIKMLGIDIFFTTSATGSLRPDILKSGDIMAISDHINCMGINPLIGKNDDEFGPRFPSMSNAWDVDLRHKLQKSAEYLGMALPSGVFLGFRGPTFETPAEIKMAQNLGGDVVGMSSIPECILARHCDMKVIGCAIITNLGAGLDNEILSHEHTLKGAKTATNKLNMLIKHFIEEL